MDTPKSIKEFSYAVFDLDGTLINSVSYCKTVFAALVNLRGISKREAQEFCTRTAGSPLPEQFRTILASRELFCSEEEIAALCAAFYKEFIKCEVKFFPGARRLIRELAARGIIVMISSGSSDEIVTKRLVSGGLTESVAVACGGTTLNKGPEHIEHFAKCLHIKTADLARHGFFCGDGETDMKIATAAGFYPIGISTTVPSELLYAAGAKRVIKRISNLLKDLKGAS